MKLKYIFAIAVAALTAAVGCQKEEGEHYLSEIQVSSSYLSFPAEGGSKELTLSTTGDWSFASVVDSGKKDDDKNTIYLQLPEWLTASPMSGSAGKDQKVVFTASAATDTRNATVAISVGEKLQNINIIQQTQKAELKTMTVAEALEIIKPLSDKQVAPGTYRVKGVVCKISEMSAQYGNATYYLSDDGSFVGSNKTNCNWLQVYRGLGLNGAAIKGNEFAVGDILTIESSLMDYGGTPETKEKECVIVEIEKSLIGVDTVELLGVEEGAGVTTFPLEGGAIKVSLKNKGNGFHVSIPAEAKSWLHIDDFGSDYVTLAADPNEGGDRGTTVTFSTSADGKEYSCTLGLNQKGSIVAVTVAEFLAAEVGDTQYRLTGVVSKGYDNDSKGQSFYIRDWSGEALVYRLDDFKASGAAIGDIITVVGKRGAYKDNPQMVNGVYEEHIATVKDKTLAEIAAAADDPNVYYIATGTVKEIANTTYGNLYLTDESGELYVYGCYPGWGASGDNRKNFLEAAGIKVGDKLSVIGVKGTHSGNPQIANGIYFSHESAL